MKKLLIFLAVAALPAAAQWRHFGEGVRVEGSFGLGVATPINPIARQLDTGWGLSGGVGVSARYLGVMLDASYTDFGVNHETLPAHRSAERRPAFLVGYGGSDLPRESPGPGGFLFDGGRRPV